MVQKRDWKSVVGAKDKRIKRLKFGSGEIESSYTCEEFGQKGGWRLRKGGWKGRE